MSNVTEKTKTTASSDHNIDMSSDYLKVFISLFVLTIIEVGFGSLETSVLKATILISLAIAKVTLIVAIFMHVKYDKNPKQIVLFSFIVPLIGAIILASVIYVDYRG